MPSTDRTPLGVRETRLDDKGRLRLPVDFFQALGGARRYFVTALDEELILIFPTEVWCGLWASRPDGEWDARYIAELRGDESDADEQGRIVVPHRLRTELGLAEGSMFVQWRNNHVLLMKPAVYEARRNAASDALRTVLQRTDL